jgi:anti-sigma-K factor RskA
VTAHPIQCGEDVAAYALGALEPEQARAFERHVETCELCRTDLATLRPAVDALPATAQPVDPPPDLKKRIMSVVEAEAKQRRAAEKGPARERRRSFRLVPAFAAAACAVALAAIVVTSGGEDPKNITATLAPMGASAELRMDDDRGTLVLEGMQPPPDGRVYQVWKVKGANAPEPTDALFRPSMDGRVSVTVPGGMDDVDEVLVSTEPPGGSKRPTTAAAIVFKT